MNTYGLGLMIPNSGLIYQNFPLSFTRNVLFYSSVFQNHAHVPLL